MKIINASNKRQDGISLEDGKKAMSFDVYKTLCNVLHQVEVEDFLFSHVFLTMELNLMERSDNVVNIHIKHIHWRLDWIIFYFGTSKVNQTGEISSDPWHVYSNPNNRSISPVLALAKYISLILIS